MCPQPVRDHVESRIRVLASLSQCLDGSSDDVVRGEDVEPCDEWIADEDVVEAPEVWQDRRVAGEGSCLRQGVVDVASGVQVAEGAGEDDLAYGNRGSADLPF